MVTPPGAAALRQLRACTCSVSSARMSVSQDDFQVTAVSMAAATTPRLLPPTLPLAAQHLPAHTAAADMTLAAATVVLQDIMTEEVGIALQEATAIGICHVMGGMRWMVERSNGIHAERSRCSRLSCSVVSSSACKAGLVPSYLR
jgi:hypothetical protein